jgi:3-oxoacyl-[acyl-carrier protein] reductase
MRKKILWAWRSFPRILPEQINDIAHYATILALRRNIITPMRNRSEVQPEHLAKVDRQENILRIRFHNEVHVMKKLDGRVALVTGGSRGIGRSTAITLAQAGCDVAVNYLQAGELAQEVVRDIQQIGRRGLAIQADVSEENDVVRLINQIECAFGRIDILVNNAGINPSKPLAEITPFDWHTVINRNLTSAFFVSQAVIPGMLEQRWGRIIMLSSIAAQTGGVIGPHYAASKAGMIGLAHSYASLLAMEGVTANAIAPALIETDMIRGNDKIKPSLLPVNRFGTTDEVAQAVLFLAENAYITGQTISINGGWYMS